MTSEPPSILYHPRARVAVSIAGAIGIHVLVIAAAWPWVKPFVLPTAAGNAQIDRHSFPASVDDFPIISGEIRPGVTSAEDGNYASLPWERAISVPPADAKLPFSFASPLQAAPTSIPGSIAGSIAASPIAMPLAPTHRPAPRPPAIAPGRRGPTIGP